MATSTKDVNWEADEFGVGEEDCCLSLLRVYLKGLYLPRNAKIIFYWQTRRFRSLKLVSFFLLQISWEEN